MARAKYGNVYNYGKSDESFLININPSEQFFKPLDPPNLIETARGVVLFLRDEKYPKIGGILLRIQQILVESKRSCIIESCDTSINKEP
ncbi:hypothetical protein PL9214500181 [Planktothrix tepida PCC 9214]|uniref:Uncharacterized protein n=1 Tax=Planktothrix tepida PCC 9214 TaxID=671072 RepID=A0A1J1LL54_9CYAN|nr:hypothetical protein PL9214500181 [Planktothrix tepida PCC 9214]